MLLVSTSETNHDALHGRTRHILGRGDQLAASGEKIADTSYLDQWLACERAAQKKLGETLAVDDLLEPRVTRYLATHLLSETPVFVASSMPVRDVEYLWPANARGVRLYFNRGANGIDGTLSTALGVAHGGQPAVLLTGDLALLHDTNGFLHRPKFRGSLTIVLINNRGGGIFQHLPIAQFEPPFETFFATPQEVDFEKLCAAYGVAHTPITSWNQFAAELKKLPANGIRVLEIKTDRKRDASLRNKLFADVAAEAEKTLV
jgi:2-succinyl-5-enolpyruvyl-6-hydroxy-3-cyclohexene-1-carboxylate synthase